MPELISELESLLADARSGKLRALAWGSVLHDGVAPDAQVQTGWACAPLTTWATYAAIAKLVFRWNHEHD